VATRVQSSAAVRRGQGHILEERPRGGLATMVAALLVAFAITALPSGAPRVPATAATATLEAAFLRESIAPSTTAPLEVFDHAHGLTLRLLRIGRRSVLTRGGTGVTGVPESRPRSVGESTDHRFVRVRIGNWPSGMYVARLSADDGRIGFAPFVVPPRCIGEHHVAVVLPTLTWQAYNRYDANGDGVGDSWYVDWSRRTVQLGRPYVDGGLPFGFQRDELPLLTWLARTGRSVDVLSQADLESVHDARTLAAAYDLIVFAGHHEYATKHEYDLVDRYRDRGGNLMFLSADNFYWRVVRNGDSITKTASWRDLGRPEARLVGVEYRASGKRRNKAWVVRSAGRDSWVFAGTGMGVGSRFGRGGVEIDMVSPQSPRGVRILAEIPDLLAPGLSAEMTYYETPRGAKVFAAGAFDLLHVQNDPRISRVLANLWDRLAVRPAHAAACASSRAMPPRAARPLAARP
jgi:N,N-dimethylformamidase beta subunit-like, C-terminal